MVLVASHDLPKTVTVVATDAKGTAVAGATLERTARPPHAAHPLSEPGVLSGTGVALHAHRHYTVALDDIAQNGCAPYVRSPETLASPTD